MNLRMEPSLGKASYYNTGPDTQGPGTSPDGKPEADPLSSEVTQCPDPWVGW